MTRLLLKLFIRQEPGTAAYRSAVGKLAGIVGILCNVLLFAAKGLAGFLVGSVAIMADAVNNLSDAASSIITLLGFHMAQRPADPAHPYGHARYEYISGLAVSFLILLVSFELAQSSVSKLLHPTVLKVSALTVGILTASILVKVWLYSFFSRLGREIDSPVLEATALDSRNDFLSTGAVLVCCLVSHLFRIHIDGIVGLIMALFIFIAGIRVTNETISPLLGRRADPELVRKLQELVLSHQKILGVHDVLVHDYGPGQCYASLHAELSAHEDPLVCHDIIDDIESDALVRLNVHLVIHYDPVLTDDPEWNRMHTLVQGIIEGLNRQFSMHDFRMIRGGGDQTKLEFDLAIPYDCVMTPDRIKLSIYEALAEAGLTYPLVIHFDFVP